MWVVQITLAFKVSVIISSIIMLIMITIHQNHVWWSLSCLIGPWLKLKQSTNDETSCSATECGLEAQHSGQAWPWHGPTQIWQHRWINFMISIQHRLIIMSHDHYHHPSLMIKIIMTWSYPNIANHIHQYQSTGPMGNWEQSMVIEQGWWNHGVMEDFCLSS